MRLQVKALHDTVNDSVRAYVEKRLAKLERRLYDQTLVEVTLWRGAEPVDPRRPLGRGDRVHEGAEHRRARERATTYEAAIDRLVEKLERQIERYRDKRSHEPRREAQKRADRPDARRGARRSTSPASRTKPPRDARSDAARSGPGLARGGHHGHPAAARVGRGGDGGRSRELGRRSPVRRPCGRSACWSRATVRQMRAPLASGTRGSDRRALPRGGSATGGRCGRWVRVAIEVVQLSPDPDGDDLELTWDGSAHALAIDGALASPPRACCAGADRCRRVKGSYALTPTGGWRPLGDPRSGAVTTRSAGTLGPWRPSRSASSSASSAWARGGASSGSGAGRLHRHARARVRGALRRRAGGEDRRVQAAARERGDARGPHLRGVRGRTRGVQADDRRPPLRRAADGRDRRSTRATSRR